MANGRIQSYLHSDRSTENKGGCMVRVECETDFAARTPEFIQFTQEVAQVAYAVGGLTMPGDQRSQELNWNQIATGGANLGRDLRALKALAEANLKEKITVAECVVMVLA